MSVEWDMQSYSILINSLLYSNYEKLLQKFAVLEHRYLRSQVGGTPLHVSSLWQVLVSAPFSSNHMHVHVISLRIRQNMY